MKIKKIILKMNEREEKIEYKNVGRVEIIGEFLVITYKIKSKILRTEPINLSMINYWDSYDE